jgi:hypothetical protein
LYSTLIFDKCNAATMIWGFIDGTLCKSLPSNLFLACGIQRSQAHSWNQISICRNTRWVNCLFIWTHSWCASWFIYVSWKWTPLTADTNHAAQPTGCPDL